MIAVTRFNGSQLYLNAELIQSIESTPDTVITLTNNVKIIVKEPAKTVIERIMTYQRSIRNPQLSQQPGE